MTMIAINLLPKSQRKAERRISVPQNRLIYLVVGAVLILLHAGLLFLTGLKKVQLISLNVHWNQMAPQSKQVVALRQEMKVIEAEIGSLKGMATRPASVTEILSTLVNAVPKGLWLDRFSLTNDGLVIQGSVISQSQNEMTIIGKFLQELRTNATFATLFEKIELNSVQRRTIKSYDVVDFVVVGGLKKI
jgi:Tfp pilus assembly protein PilN